MFGTFMIAPCGATGKTKQGYFLSRGKVVTAHSGTLRIDCPSRGECCSPTNPGTPHNCLRRFCGEPHSGFPPPCPKGLSSSDMGVRLSPLLRVPPKTIPPFGAPRTTVQPSALTRSPPTFKRRQAACESLAGRLHSEQDNIMSCDVTLGVRVKPSSKKCSACANTLYQAVRQYALKQERDETNGDGVKPGSPPAGHGGVNVQTRTNASEFEHFFGVPAESIFGGVKVRPRLFRSYT